MKTFSTIVVAIAALAMVPASVIAAPAKKAAPAHKMAMKGHGKMAMKGHGKMASAAKYQCTKCHMVYSAAEAKKDHYKCPMDGGKLAPLKTAKAK